MIKITCVEVLSETVCVGYDDTHVSSMMRLKADSNLVKSLDLVCTSTNPCKVHFRNGIIIS